MIKSQKPISETGKNPGQAEEIKAAGPQSEKDEVKAAERKMAKNIKKPGNK